MNSNEPTKNNTDSANKGKSGITSKQIVAIIGIVLLVLLYIIALVAAFVDTSSSGRFFGIALTATIVVPLLIWIYTWMYGKMTNKKTIADLNIGGPDHID